MIQCRSSLVRTGDLRYEEAERTYNFKENMMGGKTVSGETKPIGNEQSLEPQALTDHLRELRSCLIKSLLVIILGFVASYAFIKPIGTWFFKPLIEVLPDNSSLIFTSYQEGFFFI